MHIHTYIHIYIHMIHMYTHFQKKKKPVNQSTIQQQHKQTNQSQEESTSPYGAKATSVKQSTWLCWHGKTPQERIIINLLILSFLNSCLRGMVLI